MKTLLYMMGLGGGAVMLVYMAMLIFWPETNIDDASLAMALSALAGAGSAVGLRLWQYRRGG